MKAKEFRYHPIIEGLKVNEDGTEIVYKGTTLNIVPMNRRSRPSDTLMVNFDGRTCSVQRLVCEAWHGMAPNVSYSATRRNPDGNFHWKNLFWGKNGTNPHYHKIKFPRPKSSKIAESEIPGIVERLKKGETLKSIAKEFNTSDMSICRIKKRYLNND